MIKKINRNSFIINYYNKNFYAFVEYYLMDKKNLDLISSFIGENYSSIGSESIISHSNK